MVGSTVSAPEFHANGTDMNHTNLALCPAV
jgi:hypothetical protein